MNGLRIMVIGCCLSGLASGSTARAAVDLCVEAAAPADEQAGFEKLLRDQLAHHGSHRPVQSGCQSHLKAELFTANGVRYLTLRIDQAVPVRYPIKERSELADKLTEGLPLVLDNDPVYLATDISRLSTLQRMGHSLLKRGQNIYRLELFQAAAPGVRGTVFASGGALAMSRGSEHWQVMARIYAAGQPGGLRSGHQALQVMAGGDGCLIYEFSALGDTSLYLGAGAGLQYLRYEGEIEPGKRDAANELGATLSVRVGVRFLRLFDFDLDLFVVGYLPLFLTFDPDTPLLGDGIYTPSVQLGLGVGF